MGVKLLSREEVKAGKKVEELYVSKYVELLIPYRKKTRRIMLVVTDISSDGVVMSATLRSVKYPCEIPHLQTIKMILKK